MLDHPGISPVNRLNPLRVLGTIRGRRGDSAAMELLDQALSLAEGTSEPEWIAPVRAARAELSWLSGRPRRGGRGQVGLRRGTWATSMRGLSGSLAIWLSRMPPAGRAAT